jgi:hypothetical protein
VTGDVLYLQEGSGASVALTSNKVKVDSLNFTKIEMAGAKDGVRVDITLSYNSDKAELAFSKNMISSINRVAAITFDSDLLPDTNNLYSIGADNPRWKNGYFSGDLYVTGNESLTGNLIVDTDTFYVNSASNYVGIGTASPGEKLEVSGNIKFGDTIYNSYSWSPTSSNLVPDPYFNDMDQWFGETGNSLESVLLPTGEYVQSLKITTTGNVQVYSNYIPVDPEKTYRVSLWIKSDNATAGTRYFGFRCYNSAKTEVSCYKADGATTTNAYFWSGDLTADTFYKKTGYLWGYNMSSTWGTSPSDTASANYRLASDVVYIKIRFLNYYNDLTSVINWFALPTVEEVQSTNREWAIKDNGDIVSLTSGDVLISGDVGIGTTSPDYKLNVIGTVGIGANAYASLAGDLGVSRDSASTTGVIYLGSSGSSYLYFDGTRYSFGGAYRVTNVATPVNDSDVATKGYVDSVSSKAAFRYAFGTDACPTITGLTLRGAMGSYSDGTTNALTNCGVNMRCICFYSSL